MTVVVTPTTMTAAYNSLSTAQKNEFKNALGITSNTAPEGGIVFVNTGLTVSTGWTWTTLATITVPRDGFITATGGVAMSISGAPNGTMGNWAVHVLTIRKNGNQVSTVAVPFAHATSSGWLRTAITWLSVKAGDVLTLQAVNANQGSMTNNYILPTGSDYDPHYMSLSYHYIK